MLKAQKGLTGVDGGAISVASDTNGEDRFIRIVDGDLRSSVAVHRHLIGAAADQLAVGTGGHACGARVRRRKSDVKYSVTFLCRLTVFGVIAY